MMILVPAWWVRFRERRARRRHPDVEGGVYLTEWTQTGGESFYRPLPDDDEDPPTEEGPGRHRGW